MYIDYEVADKIATITLNRPEAANAQNTELLDEFDAAWTRAAEDPDVAVIVLRANGKHFSAGHDMQGRRARPGQDHAGVHLSSTRAGATSSTRCGGATFPSRRSPPCRAGASPAACCCAGPAT